MMLPPFSLLALWLATLAGPALAGTAGSFADGGTTQVSAMMMFVGNNDKVYILDKAEGNAAQINGHAAWGAVWDINTHQVELMDVLTNTFCASGMHLPNGSFATFGGNGAIGPGGNIGSQPNPGGGSGAWDQTYQDFDGSKAIRILNPCTDSDDFTSSNCQWYDNPSVLSMQAKRWYSTAEPTAEGNIVLIGGFVNGGYINRNTPNVDPQFEGGAAECTYEFYPSNGQTPQAMNFLIKTSGLNSYPHTFLMPSGKMFVQANYSTMLWDYTTNTETDLPDMPGQVVRVYPASGAAAMLPLTPANNYNPTIFFCGGIVMSDSDWGNYSWPVANTWEIQASKDCQRITPEPTDGSAPVYVQDDDLPVSRTMGQFIILPTGKLLVVNGGEYGTAGYATQTGTTLSYSQMPYGMSLAANPVGQPAIYDPDAAAGSRWSTAGLATSSIARLYHSSAILLPDASVLVAGSNPNVDVNLSTTYPTEYRAEIFYPPYFSATTRPSPSGVPSQLSYGGNPFDITIPASSYSGSGNDAAESAFVSVVRPGWTTHAMNMGQRYLQLNNTYTVNKDGSIVLHVAQMPPSPNIFQPGPAWIYVVVNGVPSNGTYAIIGSGQMGQQPVSSASVLPASVKLDSASGSASGSSTSTSGQPSATNGASSHTGLIVGVAVAGIVVLGVLGALVGLCLTRRRRAANRQVPSSSFAMNDAKDMGPSSGYGYGAGGSAAAGSLGLRDMRNSDSSAFVPLQQDYDRQAWNASTTGFQTPYRDDDQHSGTGMSVEFDPYSRERLQTSTPTYGHRF